MQTGNLKRDIQYGLLFGGLFFSVTMYLVPWMRLLFGSAHSPLRSAVNIASNVMLFLLLSPLVYAVIWRNRKEQDAFYVRKPLKMLLTKTKISAYTALCLMLYLPDIVMLQRYFVSKGTEKFALFLACLSVSMFFMGFLLHWNYKHVED